MAEVKAELKVLDPDFELRNYDFDKAIEFFREAETLRRNEILQQFSNGTVREQYRNSDLTTEELAAKVDQLRDEVVSEVVRASRDGNWHTDLTKRQMESLLQWLKRDIQTSKNEVTEVANWTYHELRDFNHLPVFVIYSTLYPDNPTVLYEVKGEQAAFERDILKDYLEGIENGESVDGKPNVVDRVLGRSWVREAGSDVDGNRTVVGGRDPGDAGVLRKQSRRKPRAAFKSVLKNLFEAQAERVKDRDVRYSRDSRAPRDSGADKPQWLQGLSIDDLMAEVKAEMKVLDPDFELDDEIL